MRSCNNKFRTLKDIMNRPLKYRSLSACVQLCLILFMNACAQETSGVIASGKPLSQSPEPTIIPIPMPTPTPVLAPTPTPTPTPTSTRTGKNWIVLACAAFGKSACWWASSFRAQAELGLVDYGGPAGQPARGPASCHRRKRIFLRCRALRRRC
mgnify:CR=1 FL=1